VSAAPELANATRGEKRLFGAASKLGRRQRRGGPVEHYSRLVARLKVLLPASAVALLLLIAAWPRIQGVIERIHLGIARLDISQARDLRMFDPRYSGIDRHDRPYTITADSARQRPGPDNLIELDSPKADLTTQSGTWLALGADSGVYQPGTQLLDLFGNVELFQDRGNEFHTDTAHIDMAQGTAEGNDSVEGHGGFGTVKADGFRVSDRGDVVVFTGKVYLVLESRQSKEPQ